jgi:aryl-phospho-beta-D-glucosidase BglC (GH1 family)
VTASLDELGEFIAWLDEAGAHGYIGEVGWPAGRDAAAWNTLAAAWYEQAGSADLEVTYWATGEWWGQRYPLSVYVASRTNGGPLDTPRPQSTILEQQDRAELRGVTVNGGEFGENVPETSPESTFSNAHPGIFETAWHYDTQASFDYLAERGITTVRLPFRWERVQPRLDGPLDPAELQRLHAVVRRAGRAGLQVILDLHNYGGYYAATGRRGVRRTVGSADLPDSSFADVWRRLSAEFQHDPAVHAYALMAEPADMPVISSAVPARRWERSSQGALAEIRARGDRTLIMVPGYNWSAVAGWARTHPHPWINDPANNFRYEAHHYWDEDSSGDYGSYSDALRAARRR